MAVQRRPSAGHLVQPGLGELWSLAAPDLELSVVIPYYNPGTRLRTTVERLLTALADAEVTFEVIAVSDGSTDGSPDALEDLRSMAGDAVRHVRLGRNGGKGQALQVGLAMGRGAYLGFIDADGDLAPELLGSFVSLMRSDEPDIILGSKRHPLSEVVDPPARRAYSWGYQQLVRTLFHLQVRDTQTGIKLVRRETLAAVLPLMVERRFAFDLELFVVASHLGYRAFLEAPIRIEERFSSTISVPAVARIFLDTLAIWGRLRVLRRYGPPRGQRNAEPVHGTR